VSKAISTLEAGLSARKAADRTRAARSILEFRERMDKDSMRERLEAVERQLCELKHGQGVVKISMTGVSIAPEAFTAFLNDAKTALAPKPIQGEVIDQPVEPLPVGLKELPGPSSPSVNVAGSLRFPSDGGTADEGNCSRVEGD
jgi:hypothetical protein